MTLCTRRGAEFINDGSGPPPRSSQIPLPVHPGRGQARLARAGEGSVHAVANWTWCPESEVGRKVIALLPSRSALTVILTEVSNANEGEGSRTASKIPRPFTCRIRQMALSEDPSPAELRERASGAAVAYFCNRRDARVRVQRRLASRLGSTFQ